MHKKPILPTQWIELLKFFARKNDVQCEKTVQVQFNFNFNFIHLNFINFNFV